MTDYDHLQESFSSHVIKSETHSDDLSSWLMKRPHEDGGFTSVFWCRVTVSEGMLTVVGDFDPVVFQGYSGGPPEAVVAWMGDRAGPDHYVMEKASMGTGREAVRTITADAAREDIAELIAERAKQIADLEEERKLEGEPEEIDDENAALDEEIEGLRHDIAAFQEGLAATVEDYGYPYSCADVVAMTDAIGSYTYRVHTPAGDYIDPWTKLHVKTYKHVAWQIEGEEYRGIGERPAMRVVLAHLAVRQLHKLLGERRPTEATEVVT